MKRRALLHAAATLPLLYGMFAAGFGRSAARAAAARAAAAQAARRRVRPADRAWPKAGDWARLHAAVGGRLMKIRSPLADCVRAPAGAECARLLTELRNPYYIGDEPGLAQLKVKANYDPDGLFFAHHGVGSEFWSADGFTRLD